MAARLACAAVASICANGRGRVRMFAVSTGVTVAQNDLTIVEGSVGSGSTAGVDSTHTEA